jgi:asparagine synthase (glutamine-hydrolysing)
VQSWTEPRCSAGPRQPPAAALAHRRLTGDTEVLLHAYLEWGPDCVSRLVGMWAFAVVDLDRDILFLSRDRFGIKPLYYARLP